MVEGPETGRRGREQLQPGASVGAGTVLSLVIHHMTFGRRWRYVKGSERKTLGHRSGLLPLGKARSPWMTRASPADILPIVVHPLGHYIKGMQRNQ